MPARVRKLDAYNAKRRFDLTTEPRGTVRPAGRSARARELHFVVQQHDATRMHFDFRLELDGVLLSWAVPKGPSLSPADKRLAVQTEDHPLDYRDFEGRIAEGQYGGGPVIVWDRGSWTPEGDPREGMAQGKLGFLLDGEKLRGGYTLIRTRGRVAQGAGSNWLLIKRDDEHVKTGVQADITRRLPASVLSGRTVQEVEGATAPERAGAKMRSTPDRSPRKATVRVPGSASGRAPKSVADKPRRRQSTPLPPFGLQLATAADRAPTGGDWVYEIKFDGYRALARIEGGRAALVSRNGQDWTRTFPAIVAALERLGVDDAVLDGEICFVDPDGRTRFGALQEVLGTRSDAAQGRAPGPATHDRLRFYLFDLLSTQGRDLRAEPLLTRKRQLQDLLGTTPPPALLYSEHIQVDGRVAHAQACAAGLEGLVAKRAQSVYRAGRGTDWLKLKCRLQQEFVIVGFTAPRGSRGGLGALVLAVHEHGQWRYRGKVGAGFTQQQLRDLHGALEADRVDQSVLGSPPRLSAVTWVRPRLVCQVEFRELTAEGRLRQPTFLGLRADKSASEVGDEKTASVEPMQGPLDLQGVRISHPDRVIDSRSGVNKGEIARYFDAVHPLLLPYAISRPLALVRCPEGDSAACFFQKHKGPGMGAAVRRARVEGQETLYIEDVVGLMQLAQFNAVELHAWGARLEHPAHPDWLVMDLDPDPALHFSSVIDAAFEIREALQTLRITSFVKTTGGKGLHVVAPIVPELDWNGLKAFSKAIADTLTQMVPERYVATVSKARRRGRIFIDYLRNGRGATAVLPYSPRARPGAPVSMPVDWKDLRRVHPQEFDVRSAAKWLARRRRDPWQEFLSLRQRLAPPGS